jgi:hypothetical protein
MVRLVRRESACPQGSEARPRFLPGMRLGGLATRYGFPTPFVIYDEQQFTTFIRCCSFRATLQTPLQTLSH